LIYSFAAIRREVVMPRLEGKVAVITGATSGIGLGTAERFITEGAKVVICARREKVGRSIAIRLGPSCRFVAADVRQEADVIHVISKAVEEFGRLDCLMNNAGVLDSGHGIEDITVEEFDDIMALMLRGPLLGMKHAAPIMRRQGSGSIINIGSVAAHRAGYSGNLYATAKAGLAHLTRCIAMDLGEVSVRVNCLSPGGTATGIIGKSLGVDSEEADRNLEPLLGVLKSAQPIPRAGLPADIASAAVFLASDDSSFITGQDIIVDGGALGGRTWSATQQFFGEFAAVIR
jgi:NAD(P)-dependent dehydrogenase (short-subunit alcohol dehydrogenase family)